MVVTTGGLCGERTLQSFWIGELQSSIYLVGRDMVEAAGHVLTILRKVPRRGLVAPIVLGSLQQAQCANDIGMSKRKRILDGTVHMALGSEMDDAVNLFVLNELAEVGEVADIHLHELIVGFVLYVFQVGKVAGVGKLIKVDNLILWILVDKESYHVATNESCATGNDYRSLIVHILLVY